MTFDLKGKKEEWEDIEKYLIEYVGSYHEIQESSDIIYDLLAIKKEMSSPLE